MNRAFTARCWTTLAIVLALSCNSFEGFEMTLETTPPADVTIDADSVIVPQGIAVGVKLLAPGAEDPETGEVFMTLKSSDPSVINVGPTVEQNVFVFYGVGTGTAVLTVDIEGEDSESVPVKVTASIGSSPGDAGATGATSGFRGKPWILVLR